jgi:hypothetical protein
MTKSHAARRRNKRARNSSRGTTGLTSPPWSIAKYTRQQLARALKPGSLESDGYTIVLRDDVALTTDGSGLLQKVYSNNPNTAQLWSTFASPFEKYRTLAFSITFSPLLPIGGSTTLFWAPIATVLDRDDSVALTSYDLACRFSSVQEFPGGSKFTRTFLMDGIDESVTVTTASPAADMWIKLYSSGNTLSTTLGHIIITWVVQFKSMGIT